MKELRSLSVNFTLAPKDPPMGGPLVGMAELIVITSEPKYTVDDGGGMVKRRVMDEFRFATTADGMRDLAKILTEYADDLGAMEATHNLPPKNSKANKKYTPEPTPLPGAES